MELSALKNVNNCFNTNIYYYLELSGGQSSILYLNVVHFLTPVLIRHLWQYKTVVILHWSLKCAVLLIIIFKACCSLAFVSCNSDILVLKQHQVPEK